MRLDYNQIRHSSVSLNVFLPYQNRSLDSPVWVVLFKYFSLSPNPVVVELVTYYYNPNPIRT